MKVTLPGKVSCRNAPDAWLGPLFTITILYVKLSPRQSGSGKSLWLTSISLAATTVVRTTAALLVGFGSGTLLETVAELVRSSTAEGTTPSVSAAVPPATKLPRLQKIVPCPSLVQDPWLE